MSKSDAPGRLAFFAGPNAAAQASDFVTSLIVGQTQYQTLQMLNDASLFDNVVTSAGGRTSFSAGMKEIKIYEHDIMPYGATRVYFEDRDPIAWAATTDFANEMLLVFPKVKDPRHRKFLQWLHETRLLPAARQAFGWARRDGVAYLYLRATGPSEDGLARGDRVISHSSLGYWQVPDSQVEKHRGEDPLLLQHGIERISIEQPGEDGKTTVKKEIHGHRLWKIVVNEGRGVIWPCYDDLWYVKDYLFAMRMSQDTGNPIQIRVDPKFLETIGEDLTADEMKALKDQMVQETAKIQSGEKHHYAPIKGLIVERVGAADLDDPLPGLRAHAGRIALTTGLSVNRILPSSRGSEQVTDEDRIDEMTAIYKAQLRDVRPLLDYLLDVARHIGVVPARTPPLPLDLHWPFVRILNPREEAYVKKTTIAAIKQAGDAGYEPDDDVSGWRRVTKPVDPRLILPKRAPEGPFEKATPQPADVPADGEEEEDGPAKDAKADFKLFVKEMEEDA